ncbi:hypothetical protein SNE40_005208 [Patella caerulea]|uniref:Uncharacterized protein n=1 Tax=Patella caerulea TaxID=87958 RepID=A0AAN8K358_PATCE
MFAAAPNHSVTKSSRDQLLNNPRNSVCWECCPSPVQNHNPMPELSTRFSKLSIKNPPSTSSSTQHDVQHLNNIIYQSEVSIKCNKILDRSKDDYKTNTTSQFEFEQVIRANCEQMDIKGTIVLDDSFHDQQLLETGQYQIIRPKINGQHVDHSSLLNIRENNMDEYFDPLGNPPPKWIKECCHNSKCLQNPSHNTCAIHCLCVLRFWHQGLTLSEIIEQYCVQPPDLFTVYYDDLVIDFYMREIRCKLHCWNRCNMVTPS